MLASIAIAGLSPEVGSAQDGADALEAAEEEAPIVANAARIDALQALVRGEHPGVPLDSVLGVSLDDDSSMNEHDRVLRLRRRNLLIAVRSAERFQNKSDEEVAQMRDQILAAALERKVLALPIEVRERLVEIDAEGGAEADDEGDDEDEEAQAANDDAASGEEDTGETHAATANAPVRVGRDRAAPPAPRASRSAPARSRSGAPANWALFFGLLFATWLLARAFGFVLQRARERNADKPLLSERVALIGRLVIYAAGLSAAFVFSFELSSDLGTIAVGGLVLLLAFALRDFVASLWSGLLLNVQRPFAVGDAIEIDGVEGKVLSLGLTSVRLLTPHRHVVAVPANQLLTKRVSTHAPSSVATPLQIDFFIDPNQDIAEAKRILEEAIEATRCVDTPRPRVILVNQLVLERMVTVRLRTKVFVMGSQPEQEIESELTERVLEGFRTHGVRLPALQAPAA